MCTFLDNKLPFDLNLKFEFRLVCTKLFKNVEQTRYPVCDACVYRAKRALTNAREAGYPCWISNEIKTNERCVTVVSAISKCWHMIFRHVRCV